MFWCDCNITILFNGFKFTCLFQAFLNGLGFFVFLLGRFGQLQDVDLDSVDPALRAGFKNPFQPPFFFFGLEKFASVLFFFFLSPFCYLSNNIICTIAHMVVVKLKYGRLEVILASFIPMKPI